jgi:hypothetical protein
MADQFNIDTKKAAKLAADHWAYVRSMLLSHGEAHGVVTRCGFHYKAAFVHGWKHAMEEVMDVLLELEKANTHTSKEAK